MLSLYIITKTLVCSPNQKLSRSRRHGQRHEGCNRPCQSQFLPCVVVLWKVITNVDFNYNGSLIAWGTGAGGGKFRCLCFFFVKGRQSTR